MKRKKLEPLAIAPLVLEDSAAGEAYRREVLGKLGPHLKRAVRSIYRPFSVMYWKYVVLLILTMPLVYLGVAAQEGVRNGVIAVMAVMCFASMIAFGALIGTQHDRLYVHNWLRAPGTLEQLPALLFKEEATLFSKKIRRQLAGVENFEASPCLAAYLRTIISLNNYLFPGMSLFCNLWLEAGLLVATILIALGLYYLPHPLLADIASLLPILLMLIVFLRKMRKFRLVGQELARAVDEYNARTP